MCFRVFKLSNLLKCSLCKFRKYHGTKTGEGHVSPTTPLGGDLSGLIAIAECSKGTMMCIAMHYLIRREHMLRGQLIGARLPLP